LTVSTIISIIVTTRLLIHISTEPASLEEIAQRLAAGDLT